MSQALHNWEQRDIARSYIDRNGSVVMIRSTGHVTREYDRKDWWGALCSKEDIHQRPLFGDAN